jgi:hypothetical protein
MTFRCKARRRPTARPHQDEGAILIIAILIITTVALVVGLVLTRGSGSLKATVALRNVAGTSYAADSAANVAINGLRKGTGFTLPDKFDNATAAIGGNTADKGCFGNTIVDYGTDNLSLNGFYPSTGTVGQSSAYIECTGEKGTGAQGSPVQINNTNKPGQAILTLGAKSGNGLQFGQSASETDYIHGSVTSNSFIKSKGTLNVTGTGVKINAAGSGGCSGTIKLNGANAACGSTSIADPNYPAPTDTPVLPAAPTCPTSNGGPAVFSPGVYKTTPDQAGISAETQRIALANTTTGGTFTPTLAGYGAVSAQLWNVTPANLQATLQGTWGINVTVSGTVGTSGVIGSVYNLTFPAILGDVTTMTAPSALTGTGGPKATVTTPTAGKTGYSNCSRSVGWLYFAPSSTTTTGVYYFNWTGAWQVSSTVVGGTLALAHDGTISGGTSIAPSGSASAPSGVGACVNPILDAKAVGVELVFGGTSQMDFTGSALKEFCATYTKTAIPTVVYGLKSAVGAGTYQVPAQSGCIITAGCTMINASNGSHAEFYFNGFVYAPWAFISLNANNNSQPFFNFGLITDTLFVGANPSNQCGQCAFINLPDNSPGYGTTSTTVLMKVHVCQGSATVTAACKTNTPTLTARVQLWDQGGDKSQRQITVLSWSHSL